MDTQLHFRVSQKAKWESKQSKTFEKKIRPGREGKKTPDCMAR